MVGALYEPPVEPTLEQMPALGVPPVEPLGVPAVEPLHSLGDVRLRRLDQEMEVVGHQAIAVAPPAVPPHHGFQELDEGGVVGVVVEDRLPTIAPRDHVIDAAGDLETGWAWHENDARAEGAHQPGSERFRRSSGEVSGHGPGSDPGARLEVPLPVAERSKNGF